MLRNVIPPQTNFTLSLYNSENELRTYSFTYKGKTTDLYTRYRFDVTDVDDANKKYQAYVLTIDKELPEYKITSNHAKPNTLMFINFCCQENAKLTLEGNGNALYYALKQKTNNIRGTYIETTFDINKPKQNVHTVFTGPQQNTTLVNTALDQPLGYITSGQKASDQKASGQTSDPKASSLKRKTENSDTTSLTANQLDNTLLKRQKGNEQESNNLESIKQESIKLASIKQESNKQELVDHAHTRVTETARNKQESDDMEIDEDSGISELDIKRLRELRQTHLAHEASQNKVPDNKVPDNKVPDNKVPDNKVPDNIFIKDVELNNFSSIHNLLNHLFSTMEQKTQPSDKVKTLNKVEILEIFDICKRYLKVKKIDDKIDVVNQIIFEIKRQNLELYSFDRDYLFKLFQLIDYYLTNFLTTSNRESIRLLANLICEIANTKVNVSLEFPELHNSLIKLFLREEYFKADPWTLRYILDGLSIILRNKAYDFFFNALDRKLFTKLIITCINQKMHPDGYISVYHAIGRLAGHEITYPLLLELKPSDFTKLTSNAFSDINKVDKSKFAQPICAIGELCEHDKTRHLIIDIDPECIADFLGIYNGNDHESNTLMLNTLSRLSEHNETMHLLKRVTPEHIKNLLDISTYTDNITWNKVIQALQCMSVLSLRKETQEIISQLKPDIMTNLVRYSIKRVDDVTRCSNIINSVITLLSLDSTQHLVESVNANDIFDLFESAVNAPQKLSKYYAMFIFYLNKLIEDGTYEHLSSKITPQQFLNLLEKTTNDDSLTKYHFSKIFTVVGRLAYRKQFNNLLNLVKPELIRKLLDIFLESSDLNQIPCFNAIWMFVTLSHMNKELVKLIKPDDVKLLIEKFVQNKPKKMHDCALMLSTTARLAVCPELLSGLTQDHYRKLIDEYILSDKSEYHVSSNMITALCSLINYRTTEKFIELLTPNEFYQMVCEIPHKNEFNVLKSKTFFLMAFLIKRPNGEAMLERFTPDLCVKLFPEYGVHNARALIQMLESISVLLEFPHGEHLLSKIRFSLIGLRFLNLNDWPTLAKKLSIAETISKLINKKIIYGLDKISPNLIGSFKKLLQSLVLRRLDFNQCMRLINIIKTYRLANILTDVDVKSFNEALLKQQYSSEKNLEILKLIAPEQAAVIIGQPKTEATKISEESVTRVEKMEIETEIRPNTVALNKTEMEAEITPHPVALKASQDPVALKELKESKEPLKGLAKAALPVVGHPEDGLLISKSSWPNSIQSLTTTTKIVVLKININDKNKLTKLAQEKNYQYDFNANKKYQPNLSLASVSSINGELGVFASEFIPKDEIKPIGIYVGSEDVDPESRYALDLEDENGNYTTTVDALHHRDWTAFINHSSTPNLILRPKYEKGKLVAAFYAIKDIKPGDQLTFDYGNDYFNQLGFKPYYLHRTDGPLTHPQIFVRDMNSYDVKLYKFDMATNEQFQLDANLDWLLPTSFKYIVQNQHKELDKFLSKEKQCVDAIALGLKDERILDEQIHITPLMYACYKGNIECIKVLLAYGAEPDRPLMKTGITPLTLLLTGLGDSEEIEQLAIKMFEQSNWPFIQDSSGLNILHYAVKHNYKALLKSIITRAHKEGVDLLGPLVEQNVNTDIVEPVADMDYCLLKNEFGLFQMLLKGSIFNRSPQFGGKFIDYCEDGSVLKDETLSKLDDERLVKLKGVLSAEDYKKYPEPQTLCARVEQEIKRRESITKVAKQKSLPKASGPNTDTLRKVPQAKQSAAMFQKQNTVQKQKEEAQKVKSTKTTVKKP